MGSLNKDTENLITKSRVANRPCIMLLVRIKFASIAPPLRQT